MKKGLPLIRIRILFAALAMIIIGFSVLIFRLFKLQIVDSDEYKRQASSQQIRTTEISPTRGTIKDRNGNVLAMSSTAWTVCISPNEITNDAQKELIISGLSEILGIKPDNIREKASRKSYYEAIKSKVDKNLAEEVTSFATNNGISAIFLEEKVSRSYPYGSFASSVIGFVNSENNGAYGLEAYYNDNLSGESGKIVSAKNAWGHDMPFEFDELYSSIDGDTIETTIDDGIQYFVEKHLELATKEYNTAARAACIAMNPNTAEVLAMATKGDFNPNQYLVLDSKVQEEIDNLPEEEQGEALLEAQYNMWRNKNISDPYEPGSIFKIITLASALDSNSITVNDTFYCQGYYEIEDRKIACWHSYGHGEETLAQALQNSCNPAFIAIGQKMGTRIFNNYFEAFGFTEKTGIDLPGEAKSIYHSFKRMSNIDLASSSFGQTFKVTPIQLITAVSAAINGGTLYKPYIVNKIIDEDGNIVEEQKPTIVRQVISSETSGTVRTLLESVTTEGSGKNARVPGYRIGGKTGTSEKLDKLNEQGIVDKYVSSFLAFAPADNPQIVILLLLDEASLDNPYGSVVAAPVVGAMMSDILPYMGIDPSYTNEELEQMKGKVNNVVDYVVHEGMSVLRVSGYSVNVVGEGTKIVAQLPEAGTKLPAGGTVTIYTEESLVPKEIAVPNVLGKSVSDVNNLIISAGLKLKLIGVQNDSEGQIAYSQNPEEGTMVYPDTTVEVTFTVGNTE